jgi:hypothetical protein
MIEGSEAGSVPRANGSGSRRPKNIRIRIRNTAFNIVCLLKELLPQATSVHGLRAAVHEPAGGSQEIRQECRPSHQGSQVRKVTKIYFPLKTDQVNFFFCKSEQNWSSEPIMLRRLDFFSTYRIFPNKFISGKR